jgi:hypothetical protein
MAALPRSIHYCAMITANDDSAFDEVPFADLDTLSGSDLLRLNECLLRSTDIARSEQWRSRIADIARRANISLSNERAKAPGVGAWSRGGNSCSARCSRLRPEFV